MAIEIVSFPMKNGDFPQLCEFLPKGSTNARSLEKCNFCHLHSLSSTHVDVYDCIDGDFLKWR